MSQSHKNFYEILGVEETASPEEIKKSYREKSRLCHPDKCLENNMEFKEANEKFKQLHEAYETLINPIKRVIYNAEHHLGQNSNKTREHKTSFNSSTRAPSQTSGRTNTESKIYKTNFTSPTTIPPKKELPSVEKIEDGIATVVYKNIRKTFSCSNATVIDQSIFIDGKDCTREFLSPAEARTYSTPVISHSIFNLMNAKKSGSTFMSIDPSASQEAINLFNNLMRRV